MYLTLLGAPDAIPQHWQISRTPPDGGPQLVALLHQVLPPEFVQCRFLLLEIPLEFYGVTDLENAVSVHSPLKIVAVPEMDPQNTHTETANHALTLVSIAGPDSGRLFPLQRGVTTLGRAGARLQINDPYLSGVELRLKFSPHGVEVTNVAPQINELNTFLWTGDPPLVAGHSKLSLHNGRVSGITPTLIPDDPTVSPGAEPTKPNLAIQAVTALSPLIIGSVMVLVTGLWFFLLFSLVSVIIAAVMVGQYWKAQKHYAAEVRRSFQTLKERWANSSPAPADLAIAARSRSLDRFGFETLTEVPVLRWGKGSITARLKDNDPSEKWLAHRSGPAVIVTAVTTPQILLVGSPADTLPVRRWIELQLLRHHLGGSRNRSILRTTISCWSTESWDSGKIPVSEEALVARLDTHELHGPGVQATQLIFDGISETTQHWLNTELKSAESSTLDGNDIILPEAVGTASSVDDLACELGTSSQPARIDLVEIGPHLLIAGTTGSGKSELLLTLLTGLAAQYSPKDLSFVLLDFKGGSSFAVLDQLPHTMTVETNLIADVSFRSLEGISTELYRRERLFLEHGVPNYETFRRQHPETELPRLVVAVDEMRVLVEQHPDALQVLTRLAATGRSLGFHVILATQRAQGTVNADIRSNIGSVICLRTSTEQESWDLLGSNIAFSISAETPGRAFLKHGSDTPLGFQTARVSLSTDPPIITSLTEDSAPTQLAAGEAPWPRIAEFITAATESAGHRPPQPIVLPELPDAFRPPHQPDGPLVLGLVDDPTGRKQPVTTLPRTSSAHVAWIGADTPGISGALHRLLLDHADSPTGDQPLVFNGTQSELPTGGFPILDTDTDEGALETTFAQITSDLRSRNLRTIIFAGWGHWAGRRFGTTFETVEERVISWLRDYGQHLRLFVFGNRELAGGRVIAQVNHRFYLPLGVTPEQRIIWPPLLPVANISGRAVMVSPDTPPRGLTVQLSEPPDYSSGQASEVR